MCGLVAGEESHFLAKISHLLRTMESGSQLSTRVSTSPSTARMPTYEDNMSEPASTIPVRPLQTSLPLVVKSKGHFFRLDDGREILDACGGAGVASIGHGNAEVISVMTAEANNLTYVPWAFFDNQSTRDLQDWLVQSTGGELTKVYLQSSGSEAVEAAIKLAREYFVWSGQPQRISFVARWESYHGTTVGSLSLSGYRTRRANFEEILLPNVHRIPACNPYRQQLPGESDQDFVGRKAAELDQVFLKAGPDTIAALIVEPVVGAALGCVPAPPGYFKALRAVCDRHGALFILDEVMCGMGRTGTTHAWEQEGVVPDIQCVGKGLAGGYLPCSAVLAGRRVVEGMTRAGAVFTHGHTFQNHAVVSAAALAVQRIVRRDGLLGNVREQGHRLGLLLRQRLGGHPHVGSVRGRGLFWGVELVRDRQAKEPFEPALQVARLVHQKAMAAVAGDNGGPMLVYFGQGCAGGGKGDQVLIMPAYNVTQELVAVIVQRLVSAVDAAFQDIAARGLLI